MDNNQLLKFNLIGHPNHGKSSLGGLFSYKSNTFNKKSINKNTDKKQCLAHLSDITDDERLRGITLELNKISFKYQNKYFSIYDSPGHGLLIREMVLGCSLSNVPILVISISDYEHGIIGQTFEHTVIARCNSSSLIVAWNKMDMIQWSSVIYHS